MPWTIGRVVTFVAVVTLGEIMPAHVVVEEEEFAAIGFPCDTPIGTADIRILRVNLNLGARHFLTKNADEELQEIADDVVAIHPNHETKEYDGPNDDGQKGGHALTSPKAASKVGSTKSALASWVLASIRFWISISARIGDMTLPSTLTTASPSISTSQRACMMEDEGRRLSIVIETTRFGKMLTVNPGSMRSKLV